MDISEEVRGLYEDYQEQFRRQEQERKPGMGVFGLGVGPKDYPCHGQFAQALEALLQDIAARRPDSAQVRALLDFIYADSRTRQNGEDAVSWMMLAVHSLTLCLIPLLDPSDAKALCDSYQNTYPRRKLLPAQEKVLAALRARFK